MGTIWERQIRTARLILIALMKTHGKSLDDDSLHILFVEVEVILNSQPMTTVTISDEKGQIKLPASNLLTMKSNVIMPPPRNLSSADIYS